MKSLLFGCAAVATALSLAPAADAALLLQYQFDEVAGATAADSGTGTGTPAPGTLAGAAAWTASTPAGASAGALDASAANSYVNAGDVAKLDGLSALTITAWVNLRGVPANGNRIAAKQLGSGNFDGFSFAFNNPTDGAANRRADNFQLNLALGGTGGFTFATPGANIGADHEWVFVAATYDGAGVSFYTGDAAAAVAQFGSTFAAAAGTLVANANDFRVAASSTGTASAPVWIDDVRVYDTALTVGDLDAIRLANLPEPASLSLLSLAAAPLLHRRRRR